MLLPGSNAILGDVDIMVEISGDIVRTATVTKANDMPEGPLFSFKSDLHEFGTDEDGDPVTVNVVSSETVDARQPAQNAPKLKPNQQTLFAILHGARSAGLTLEDCQARTPASAPSRPYRPPQCSALQGNGADLWGSMVLVHE